MKKFLLFLAFLAVSAFFVGAQTSKTGRIIVLENKATVTCAAIGDLYFQTGTSGQGAGLYACKTIGAAPVFSSGASLVVDVSTVSCPAVGDLYFQTGATGSGVGLYACKTVGVAPIFNGEVASVGLSLPNIFTVSGSPVITSGTLAGVLATQSANAVFTGPASGGVATPTFRALVTADVPPPVLISPVTTPNPLAFNVDLQLKGPNPWLDVTRFGARGATPFQTTATMGAASTTATLASASSFQNSDGVVIDGAGATNTMGTPGTCTVTPSLAAGAMNTGNLVNSAAGATTYSYQFVFRNKNRAMTAASAVCSTTTGLATLGSPAVTVSTLARANNVVTVTTATPHDFVVGAVVYVTQSTDATFSGYYVVDTAPTTTTFTYKQGMDTRGGATASATGGTVRGYFANKITLPTYPAGGWQAYIWLTGGSGSPRFVGVTRPLETILEDYGATFMAGILLPSYVPATPPSVATNDALVTTILSGGGTTTLTLANASTNAVTAAVIKYDDAPGILAAANAATSGTTAGVLYLPASRTFTVNSLLTLPNSVDIWQAGSLTLNETLQMGVNLIWAGDIGGSFPSAPQFAPIAAPLVLVATAYPGIYFPSFSSSQIRGLTFAQSTNQGLIMLTDGGNNAGFESVNFTFGTGNADYMGMALVMRGGFAYGFKNSSFSNSGPGDGLSTTPVLFRRNATDGSNPPGRLILTKVHFSGRGIHQHSSAGPSIYLEHIYSQAMKSPLLTLTTTPGTFGGFIDIADVVTDTSPQAVLANWTDAATGVGMSALVKLENVGSVANEAGGVPGILTGKPINGVVAINSGFLGQNLDVVPFSNASRFLPTYSPTTPTTNGDWQFRVPVHFPAKHNLFWDIVVPTNLVAGAPTAGGTVPIGAQTYKIAVVGQMGGVSNPSSGSTVTTDASNRTVPLTWTGAAGAASYKVYRNDVLLITVTAVSGTNSYTDTGVDFLGQSAPGNVSGTGVIEIGADNSGVYRIVSPNVTIGDINGIPYVDAGKFPQTRAGLQAAIDSLPARGGLVIIPKPFALDATTVTVGSNGTGEPRTTGKSVMLYFASMGAWTGTANPMFSVADRSGIKGLGRSTYLQNTGASGARLIDILHNSEEVVIRDLGLLSKGPAIKCQGSCTGTKWSNLFIQAESGNSIETQSWLDTAEASGIFISHQSATGSCWRMGVTGTGGSLEWGINNAAIRDLTCQTAFAGAGPSLHFESDGATPNAYGSGIIENIQILNARKEAFKIRGTGSGPFRISGVKIGSPTLDAGTFDAITIANTASGLTGITLEGVEGQTAAYRYGIDWTSGSGRIKHVSMGSTTATVNVNNQIILQDVNATIAGGIKVPRYVANGTALVAGDFSLVAGPSWGSTASITSVTGVDQWVFLTISSSGTGQALNPTLVHTAKDGTWTNTPVCSAITTGGTGAVVDWTVTARSATSCTYTFNATPVAGLTYEVTLLYGGR